MLLEKGADANAKSRGGESLLENAVVSSGCHVVELLLDNGADANARNKDGETLLHRAVRRGDRDAYPELIKMLLEKGVDANAQDKDGKSPLEWAIERNYPRLVKMLLEKGVDANAQRKDGKTLVQWAQWAADTDSVKLVKMLVDRTMDGNTVLSRILGKHTQEEEAQERRIETLSDSEVANKLIELANILLTVVCRGTIRNSSKTCGLSEEHWTNAVAFVRCAGFSPWCRKCRASEL